MSLEKLTQLKQKLNQIPSQGSVTVGGLQNLMSSKLAELKQSKPVASQPLSQNLVPQNISSNPLLNTIGQTMPQPSYNQRSQSANLSRPSFEQYTREHAQQSNLNNITQAPKPQSISQSFNYKNQNPYPLNSKPKSSSKSNSKPNFRRMLIIGVVSILLLSTIAGLGVFGYFKFIYKDNSLYKANSDLISGSIQKLDKDFGLINKLVQVEGENCTSVEPSQENEVQLPKCIEPEDYTYYSAGKFLKGKLKDLTRIIAVGNKTGNLAMFATKDYTKFVLNGDPELNNIKEDNPQYPYKLFRQDKFSSIDLFENELPSYFNVGSIFSIAKSNPNPVVNQTIVEENPIFSLEDKESKIVGNTNDNDYPVYAKKDDNNAISYFVKDKSGLSFAYNFVFKSSIEKRNNLDQEGKKIQEETQKIQQALAKEGSNPEEEGFEDKILAKLKEKFPSIEDRLNICEFLPTLLSPEIKTASSKFFYRYGSDKDCTTEKLDFAILDLEQGDIEKVGDSKVGDQLVYRLKPESKIATENSSYIIANTQLESKEKELFLEKNPSLVFKTPFNSYLVLFVENDSQNKVINPVSEENITSDTQKEAAIDSNTKAGNGEISEPKTDSPKTDSPASTK
jgi:hypothetical protein